MTDNRTIKLAIVGALTSASAFIVGGPVMSAHAANAVEERGTTDQASLSTVNGAPHSKHPRARSIVTPLAPHTKSQVTPLAPHTKSQATQLRDPDALPAGVADRVAAIQNGC
jgi:hypothetical protein